MTLSPCPFCGGRAHMDGDELTLDAFVECSQCHAQSPLCRGGPKALEMWNRRAEPEPAPVRVPDAKDKISHPPTERAYAQGFNACRAEVVRLNGERVGVSDGCL